MTNSYVFIVNLLSNNRVMKPPKLPSFFKTKEPNQFNFEPRYYNAQKEKMKERYDRISREMDGTSADQTRSENFKSTLKENWGNSYSRNRTGSQLNKRVVIYVLLLLALTYYFLFR